MPLIVAESLVLAQTPSLAHIAEDIGAFVGESLRLFVNDVIPTGLSTPDDFVEAEFTSYSAQTADFGGTVELRSDGSTAVLSANAIEWIGPSDDSGQTVYGYYITEDPPTVLYAAYRFPTPVSMMSPTDVLTLVTGLRIPPIGG